MSILTSRLFSYREVIQTQKTVREWGKCGAACFVQVGLVGICELKAGHKAAKHRTGGDDYWLTWTGDDELGGRGWPQRGE